MAASRISSQTIVTSEKAKYGIQWLEIWRAFADYKLWVISLMYFSCNTSYGSLPVFLPKMLEDWGHEGYKAQGYTAPPYLAAFFVVLITTYVADRTSQHGVTISLLALVGATGYIMLALTVDEAVRYAGVFLATAGIFPVIANTLPWVLYNQGTSTRKGAGVAMVQLIGQCGSLLGTFLFPKKDHPRYQKGMWVCGGFMLLNAFLAIVLRTALDWENRKLDKKKADGFKYSL